MARPSPGRQGRRLVLFDAHARQLRGRLFQLYGHDDAYRRLVRDRLRPQWRAVPLRADAPGRYGFSALRRAAKAIAADPALRRYVAAVDRAVAETLGLRSGGRPATWAGDYVHAVVANPYHLPDELLFAAPTYAWSRPGHQETTPPYEVHWENSYLSIMVSPIGAVVRWASDPNGLLDVRGQAVYVRGWHPGPGMEWGNFDNWDDLANAAHQVLTRELGRLRAAYGERYGAQGGPASQFRNRAALAKEREVLVPALFRLLYHGDRPPRGVHRQTLRRLAKRIGVDLPRR